MPGRRSHEYFPQLSSDGKWLVWGITQRGHDHDIADYEIYLWEVGTPFEKAVRLSYNSGNDRWPDIFIPSSVNSSTASADSSESKMAASAEPAEEAPSKAAGKKHQKGKK